MITKIDCILKNCKLPWAIVIGMEMRTSLGIIRSLGRYNIPVLGINLFNNSTPSTFSKYCKVIININLDNLIKTLMDLIPLFSYPPVIFAENEDICILLDNNKDILDNHYKLMLSKKFPMVNLTNKYINYLICQDYSEFLLPKTKIIYKNDDSYSEKIKDMSFPLIIKPTHSGIIDKANYFIIKNRLEAKYYIEMLLKVGTHLIIQEYISSPDDNNYEVLCYRSRIRDNTYCLALKKHRIYPKNTGSSSFIESTYEIDNIFLKINNFLRKIDYNGLADFDFKIKNDMVYLIEINYRASANISITEKCGLNLPYIAFNDMTYKEPIDLPDNYKVGIKWCFESSEIASFREKYISFKELLRSLLLSDSRAIFAWDDVFPLIPYIKNIRR